LYSDLDFSLVVRGLVPLSLTWGASVTGCAPIDRLRGCDPIGRGKRSLCSLLGATHTVSDHEPIVSSCIECVKLYYYYYYLLSYAI